MDTGRRKTRVVRVGKVKIGGKNAIAIQSMAKTDTLDAKKTAREIQRLEKAGCEIIRVAVRNAAAARNIGAIKRKINIPLVADIHFDWRLALECIKNGADKIRINPGNISNPGQLKEIIKSAKRKKIPIRIGINSGSLATKSDGRRTKEDLFVRTALGYIKLFEKERFRDIIISLKSSNVRETIAAYRMLAGLCDYPFHLGVTAAGPHDSGIVKSSIGIGALLADGIGDTIRVSLTEDAVYEVVAAKQILKALRLRAFGPDIISCPACGRCRVDLAKIIRKIENDIRHATYAVRSKPITIAIMGCEVNGPGEAREADIGVAFGKKSALLFKKGKVIKKVNAGNAVREILKCAGRKP